MIAKPFLKADFTKCMTKSIKLLIKLKFYLVQIFVICKKRKIYLHTVLVGNLKTSLQITQNKCLEIAS